MARIFLLILISTLLTPLFSYSASFPQRPVKIYVYTRPGGAIDVFSRKFSAVAERLSGKQFLIVNKPGAGGVIALKKIMRARPDGYTIGAVTKSNIGKMVTARVSVGVENFSWLAKMVRDPEALIVNESSGLNSWKDILAEAQQKNGAQKWLGPAMGGNDHITALKLWKATGIKAKWIPYSGGGKAMAALLGGHGSLYVGNPGDVLGKKGLKAVAVSSDKRLEGQFSHIPTFSEAGIEGLDSEIMWRGFLSGKRIPKEAKDFYADLFAKVNKDPEWRKYIQSRGAEPIYVGEDQFLKHVKSDYSEFRDILKGLGRRVND